MWVRFPPGTWYSRPERVSATFVSETVPPLPRFLSLEASHVGSPVCLRAPVDVWDIFSRRPRSLIDVVDGTCRVIPPTADAIAKRRVTGEAVLWLVAFT